jgi:hypothetical protein
MAVRTAQKFIDFSVFAASRRAMLRKLTARRGSPDFVNVDARNSWLQLWLELHSRLPK